MGRSRLRIDYNEVDRKATEIGTVLDGLTLPMVLMVLSYVVMAVVGNARLLGVDVVGVVCRWMAMLAKSVKDDATDGLDEILN